MKKGRPTDGMGRVSLLATVQKVIPKIYVLNSIQNVVKNVVNPVYSGIRTFERPIS